MSDGGNLDASTDDINENNKRSERKRQREKQRRSDLTSAFEELSDLILKIEPGVLPAEQGKKKKKSTGDGSDTLGSGMTRLDIVARTVEVVKALYEENEKNKRLLEEMKRSGGGQRDDKVLVMVPTLTLVDDQQPTAGRGIPPTQAPQHQYPRYSYPYPQAPPAFAPPSAAFAPPYFAPPPSSMGHQARPNWDSGSPIHSAESRGMYPPMARESQAHHHARPPHYYDYSEYSRRSDSRNSDDRSQQSDRSMEPEEI